jgi:hypothetical protein
MLFVLDSSASHVAAAFRIPTTVIMPAINDPKIFGPLNDQANILTFKTPCAPCFRSGGCDHGMSTPDLRRRREEVGPRWFASFYAYVDLTGSPETSHRPSVRDK